MARFTAGDEQAPVILVVDDNQDNLVLLRACLSAAGYTVRLARGGAYALTSARADPPDLVLLDVLMPDLDGFAVCRELKVDPVTRDVPVIFISALQESSDKVKAFATGAVDYIPKPFDEHEVLARVGTHLRLQRLQRQLERRSAQLEQEVHAREQAEREVRAQAALLQRTNDQLESRVAERTAELTNLNRVLRAAIEERRINEEHYRALVETVPSGIIRLDAEGCIRFCNRRAIALFQVEAADELRGRPFADLVHPEARARFELQLQQSVDGGAPVEVRLLCADDSAIEAEVSITPLNLRDQLPGTLLAIQDITARKQAERELHHAYAELAAANQALHQQRDLLYAIVDGIEEGLLLLDPNGQVQLVNRALGRLLCVAPEHLERRPWSAIEARLASDEVDANGAQHPTTTQIRRLRYRNSAGQTHILELHEQPRQQTGQTIIRVTDVTETTRLEGQLMANERFVAAGRLAASVAHEINTPLQSIQLALEMVSVAPREEGLAYVREAARETQRVGSIVRQLLDVYRPAPQMGGAVALNALIERVLLLLRKRALDNGVQLDVALTGAAPQVYGRSDELTQVVINLVINGIEAMDRGGRLRISTECADEEVLLHVADTGPGIASELLPTIFEPFVTTKADGTGQGLMITKQLVERHQGRIEVQSEPGRGATFTVVLPALCEDPPATPVEDADA